MKRDLWIEPTTWVHSVLAVALTLGLLYADSFPARMSAPCWIASSLPAAYGYVFRAISGGRRRSSFWVVTVCLLIMITSLATRWPFQVRMALSREALETEARRLLSVPAEEANVPLRERWGRFYLNLKAVGIYTIQTADVDYDRRHVYISIGGSVVR